MKKTSYFTVIPPKKKKLLFLENGEEAGLYDVCEWILSTYPKDIFVNKPFIIINFRDDAKKILKMRNTKK